MAARKKQDAAKAKAKRQKVMAAGGAVLLLGLLAVQVPRTMKMLNAQAPPPPPPAAAPTTGVPTDPSVLPTPGTVGGGAAPTASGDGTLVDSDVAPAPDSGQLVAFGRFASKDPFVQQIDDRPNQGDGTAAPAPESPGPAADGGGEAAPGAGGVSPSPGGSSPAVPKGSAILVVNGVEEVVAKGSGFPKSEPVFTLVSLAGASVRIAVAGGAFASGSRTVELLRGKTLTLVNTADGTRFELKLVASGG
jgi:hypothetical protein